MTKTEENNAENEPKLTRYSHLISSDGECGGMGEQEDWSINYDFGEYYKVEDVENLIKAERSRANLLQDKLDGKLKREAWVDADLYEEQKARADSLAQKVAELESKLTCKYCGGTEHNTREHEWSSENHDLHLDVEALTNANVKLTKERDDIEFKLKIKVRDLIDALCEGCPEMERLKSEVQELTICDKRASERRSNESSALKTERD